MRLYALSKLPYPTMSSLFCLQTWLTSSRIRGSFSPPISLRSPPVHQRPHVIGQKAARGMEHAKNSVIMNWSASNMVNEIFEARRRESPQFYSCSRSLLYLRFSAIALSIYPLLSSQAYEANSIFNLVNATLGIGVLGLPYCFMNCGVVLTPILMVLCAAFMYHSVQLLVEVNKQFMPQMQIHL